MRNTIIVNIGSIKIKLGIFSVSRYKQKLHFEAIKNLSIDKIDSKVLGVLKIKKNVAVLFLCFLTSMFAYNQKLEFLEQIDAMSKKKQDSINDLTHFEIQKLKSYSIEAAQIKNEEEYLNKIHTFTKDSLQILAVKLTSIKELNAKNLLDKDIANNKDFYISLLKDLKESDITPEEYVFLENKLSKFLIKEIETKYSYSKLLNILLGISLIGMFIFLVKSKHKGISVFSLSKQETNVKKMILEGKSNKEIAEELFISLSTVKTHITNIYQKLNVSNRGDLISKFKNTPRTST